MNEELNIDPSRFEEEYERQEFERTLRQAEEKRQKEEQEEEVKATATPQPSQKTEEEPEPEPGSLLDVNFFGEKKDVTGGVLESTNQFIDDTS